MNSNPFPSVQDGQGSSYIIRQIGTIMISERVSDAYVYGEICQVIGRAAVLLCKSGEPVTKEAIQVMLEIYSEQQNDDFMNVIYEKAINAMD